MALRLPHLAAPLGDLLAVLAASAPDLNLWALLIGGGGLAGLGGLGATLFLLRANRDDTIARAARTLVEGQGSYADRLSADLDEARGELRELGAKVEELTREVRAARQDANDARAERDDAVARAAQLAAALAGRRRGDEGAIA